MDFQEPTPGATEDTEAIIVKADEVDEAGADISTISPQNASDESDFNARIESRRVQDAQSTGSPKILANAVPSPPRLIPRPILRRESSIPAPPQQPPPPAPPQQREEGGNPTDSLSLLDLKRLVSDLPKLEPTAYAYEYEETRSFPEELEEWFQYTEEEKYMLLRAKQTFVEKWDQMQAEKSHLPSDVTDWIDVPEAERMTFAQGLIQRLDSPDLTTRVVNLECISYIALGAWGDTAGVVNEDTEVDLTPLAAKWSESLSIKPRCHLRWIFDGTKMLCRLGVVQKLVDTLKSLWDSEQSILLLFWKAFLLLVGQIDHVEECKRTLRVGIHEGQGQDPGKFITASPLDYHLFRQEITSKYPAYSPPQPLVPIEPENNSVLPPLPNHPSRQRSHENLNIPTSGNNAVGSIFNQPVHIATPAPSPPPSPAGPGGKGGKKQNYQTNQSFPFLYPPLDDTSSILGGKGSAELQDKLVGKRWEGGDVPASILEAGELFANRMRMSRSLRQLWEVRERYIKHERGWNESHNHEADDNVNEGEASEFDHLDAELHGYTSLGERRNTKATSRKPAVERVKETDKEAVQSRLDAMHDYYRVVLPDLQSLVIVLWKALFQNVSALVANSGQNGLPNAIEDVVNDSAGKRKTNQNSSASLNGLANGHLAENEDATDLTIETLNDIRLKEISSKAVSGILLIMLKWFKLSRKSPDELRTKTNANFIQIYLSTNVDKAVEQKNDREDLDFFAFCHNHSKRPPIPLSRAPASTPDSSEDEAAPPPIRKHRRSPTSRSPLPTPPPPTATKPEVDELGIPIAGPLPQTPLTDYAPRFFLTNINLLRLLQKITKRKAHRALLLVQYKSSTILRKALKIPQPELRLYTLKLFKSQVPYCGRKWRQTNMRVITAIYLHCRPELRDEWLCGGDVDGVVEEAVPFEQAGRSLVHWWHLKEFRDVMEGKTRAGNGAETEDTSEQPDEYNFFARELDKMGWGLGGFGGGEDEEGMTGAGDVGSGGGNEFEGGPLQMEGWA
ncbi:MAG: hypothetical protein Q9217_004337 [Psora testacea]